MTGMTKDYAIAILRRMQEPEPFEPQINESAFDALEMAIKAIQKYSTWSQTYSNMVEDVIFRKAAVDVIHKYYAERIEQSPMHKTVDGEVYDLGICNPLLADNKALSQAIKDLPSALPDVPDTNVGDTIYRQATIDAVLDLNAEHRVSWKDAVIDLIDELPSAHPEQKTAKWITNSTTINCSGCKHCSWSKNAFEDLVRSFNFCPNCGADMRGGQDERLNQ